MSTQESNGQQMQAEQPKEEPKLSERSNRGYTPRIGAGGDADLGYLSEDGDPKFQRPRRDIASL
jgi:hypothetical protein